MSALEPSDVGPRAGGDRPADQVDRDLVVSLLDTAYSDGRLNVSDYQSRRTVAQGALVLDDLIPLTRDLIAPSAPATSQSSAGLALPDLSDSSNRAVLVGVFSGATRRGHWSAPGQISAVAVFGGNEIDLRQADWSKPVIETTVLALFGGIEIKVPPGVEIDNQTVSIFGGVDVKGTGQASTTRRLIVKGLCCFGGVSVVVK
ncbi:MAG: DUF1707 domain-containing protein [Propionibacteriaceae bacterium]|nr:DUF1707 domain-containing protein [Propionibacteriaceae bacterium]